MLSSSVESSEHGRDPYQSACAAPQMIAMPCGNLHAPSLLLGLAEAEARNVAPALSGICHVGAAAVRQRAGRLRAAQARDV